MPTIGVRSLVFLLQAIAALLPLNTFAFAAEPKTTSAKTVKVPVNLALKKPATASNSQAGHAPENGVDGNLTTRWCSPDNGVGYWWQVDLGQLETLTGCEVTWEQDDKRYQYRIEGSPDGKSWGPLVDFSKSELREQIHTHKFDKTGIRYLRLTTTGVEGGAWGSFLEFQAFGTQFTEKTVAAAAEKGPLKAARLDGLLKEVKIPADFDVTLFAAPPNVSYPTCLTVTPTGEVYVGIDENGSLGRDKNRVQRIVRCVDTNGDGQADQFNTFADNVVSVRGMVWDDDRLYVLHPPFLRVFYDDNRDGTADRDEVLVDGIGFDLKFRGADHTTNGMQLGIDGWLYVAVGDYGFVKGTGKDGKSLQFRGGGIVRVRTDGTELEVVSRGQRNIYDVAISPRMELFTRDNTNDGGGWNVRLSHVIPTAQMGYPSLFKNFPDEIVQPLIDYGGGSPCGALFVDEPGLPASLTNTLLTCEWGRSAVFRHPLKPNGANFTPEQFPFVELPRPTDIDVDGQSRFYISTWRNGGFAYDKPEVGYIARVALKEGASTPFPNLKAATDAQLAGHLASLSHTCRLHTQREILRRGAKFTQSAAIEKLIKSGPSLEVKVAAIFTLKQLLGTASHPALIQAAASEETREHALKALADRQTQLENVPADLLVRGLSDASPRVRLQAALGLGRLGNSATAAALVPVTADADPLVSHAAVNALIALHDHAACFAELDKGATPALPGVIRVLQAQHTSEVVNGLLARLDNATNSQLKGAILRALCRLHFQEAEWKGDWWSTRPDTSGPFYKHVTWAESDRILAALKQAVATSDPAVTKGLLVDLQRHKIDFAEATNRLLAIAETDSEFRLNAVKLLAERGQIPVAAVPLLETVANDAAVPTGSRGLALVCLLKVNDYSVALESATRTATNWGKLSPLPGDLDVALNEYVRDGRHATQVPQLIQRTKAGELPIRSFAWDLLVNVAQLPNPPREAASAVHQAIEAAWKSPATAVELLESIGRTKADLFAYQVQALLKDERPPVRQAAERASLAMKLDDQPAGKRIAISTLTFEDVVSAVQTGGDAKLGQRLFARQGCVACHTVSPNEPLKGPMLRGIAERYKRPELTESILKPSAKIAQGFETQFFVTDDGKAHEGFVVRESGDEIEMRNVSGISTVLKKSDIDERGKRELSVMPIGLADKLTTHELASLLAYLESLKSK